MQRDASYGLDAEIDVNGLEPDDASTLSSPADAKRLKARRRDHQWHFLRQWVRHPLRTASMLPSSRALAKLMVSEIGPHCGNVLELGGGTGALTEAILRSGVALENLTVVELNARFAELLQQEYPGIRVVRANAQHLLSFVPAESLGAVISSLPLLSMSPREQRMILTPAFAALRVGGHVYQYTYGHRCPVSREVLADLGLSVQCLGGTLRNWPPARVYRLTRTNRRAVPPAPRFKTS